MVRPTLRAVAISILLSSLVAPAWAGFDEADAAYQRGDYETALRELRPLANQGNANAQNNLGRMYARGEGVPRDDAEAVRWFRKAAERGYAKAQYNLGTMYHKGEGVPQDHAEAVRWYRKAADQGYAEAQNNLGVMYREGWGVLQDYVRAHMWYSIAAENFWLGAKHEMAVMNRNYIAKFMTPAEIAEAKRLMWEWRTQRARWRRRLLRPSRP